MHSMNPRNVTGDNALSDDDLASLNAQLDAADVNAARPFESLVYVDLDEAEREFEEGVAFDTEASDRFVPAPGRVRCDCGWKLGEQASRAVITQAAAAAARTATNEAEPTSQQHRCDGQPPLQHAGPGGHSTPHLCLTPRITDQDPARA